MMTVPSRRQHDTTTAMEVEDWFYHGTIDDVVWRRRGDVDRSLRRDGMSGVRIETGLRQLH